MWYLVYFLHRYLDFRLQELESLLQLARIDYPQDFEASSATFNASELTELHINAGEGRTHCVSASLPTCGDINPSLQFFPRSRVSLVSVAVSLSPSNSPVCDTLLSLSAEEHHPEAKLDCHAGSIPDDHRGSTSSGVNGTARESTGGVAGNGDGQASQVSLLRWRKPEGDHVDSPFFYVDLPSDDVARAIASRSE